MEVVDKFIPVKVNTGRGFYQLQLRPNKKGQIVLTHRTSGSKLISICAMAPEEALALQAAINDCLLQMEENNDDDEQ